MINSNYKIKLITNQHCNYEAKTKQCSVQHTNGQIQLLVKKCCSSDHSKRVLAKTNLSVQVRTYEKILKKFWDDPKHCFRDSII